MCRFILDAIAVIARAEGMRRVAEDASVGGTSLYETLPGADPAFATILRVLDAVGVRLVARPINGDPDQNREAVEVAGFRPS
jgi:probable addiction module antidote protein